MHKRITITLAIMLFCTVSYAHDFSKGDLVVAQQETVLSKNEATMSVPRGQELVVEKAREHLLQVNNGIRLGWIQADTVVPSPKQPRDVSFSIHYRMIPKGATELVILTTHVPRTLPGRQTIRSTVFSQAPAKLFQKNDNQYAVFIVHQLDQPSTITITVEARIYGFDLATAAKGSRVATLDREELKRWLVQERRLEKDAPEVQAAAAKIAGADDDVEIARNVMKFVHETLRESNHMSKQLGAVRALQEKRGDCTEYSDLFVALCRAKGIPSRTCDGYVIPPSAGATPRHKWAEFYTNRLGWVPVDPLWIELGRTSFDRLSNKYVYSTRVRNDLILENNEFCVYRYYGDPIRFEDPVVIHTQ